MPGGSCTFQDMWLKEKEFSDWLRKGNSSTVAYCSFCAKSLSLERMGRSALLSHMSSKKHVGFVKKGSQSKPITDYITIFNSPIEETSTSDHSQLHATSEKPVDSNSSFLSSNAAAASSSVVKAEIKWTMHTVYEHHSYRSNASIKAIFNDMFSDSTIAQQFTCGENKTNYLATFGLAPYFKSLISKNVENADEYVLLYDESLNKSLKQNQMDVHVRYWHLDQVSTVYFQSEFFGHSRADDIFDKLLPIILDFDKTKLVQLSMDAH